MLGNIFKKRYRRKALETNVYSNNETVLFYAQAAVHAVEMLLHTRNAAIHYHRPPKSLV